MRTFNTLCLVGFSLGLICGIPSAAIADSETNALLRDIERYKAEDKIVGAEKSRIEAKEQESAKESSRIDADTDAINQMKRQYDRNPNEAYRAQINRRVAAHNEMSRLYNEVQASLRQRIRNYNHDVESLQSRRAQLIERANALQQAERATPKTAPVSGSPRPSSNATEYTKPQPTSTATSKIPRGPRLGFDDNVPRRTAK